jgi:hypothetical protein
MEPRFQRICNVHWPFHDSGGRGHAEGIPRQYESIAVRARVVFERSGERWLDGWAVAWTKDSVCVDLDNPRLGITQVWLAPSDVKRRLSAPSS